MYSVAVFISHSWAYSHHYERLAEWIFEDDWNVQGTPLVFNDVSVPKNNPIHYTTNEQELRNAIYARIRVSQVVVIPTGMYASYSGWIQKEIDGAAAYGIPILAVNPWAQERKSSVVIDAASAYVGWNKQSVVDKVWELARNGTR